MSKRASRAGGQEPGPQRRGYHHGGIPEAALAVARDLVERHGHAAVTMRDVASALGVAPSALYRHFENRVDLLVALADQLHAELRDGLRDMRATAIDPRAAMESAGLHFLGFAEVNPRLFLMMYDAAVTGAPEAAARLPALQGTYASLSELAMAGWPTLDETGVQERMIGFWSTLFGYAWLRAQGLLLPYMLQGLDHHELARGAAQTALLSFARP